MTITATWNDSPNSPGYDIAITGLSAALNSNQFFESGTSPWTAINGGTLSQSSAQFHQGAFSLLLTPDGVTSNPETRSEAVTGILPFVSYTVDLWVRCAVTRNVNIGMIWRDGGGVLLTTSTTTVALTANTWTRVVFKATSPASTAQANILVGMAGVAPGSNLVFVDEAKLAVDYSYYTVTRQDLTGFLTDADVRKAGTGPDGLISTGDSDTAALSDYEFSFNTNIRYLLRKYDRNKNLITSENTVVGPPPVPTTAYYGHAWLKDVATPSNSRPIIVGEFKGYSRSGRVTTIDVLNRAFPVAITDVMSGKSGELSFYILNPQFGGAIPSYSEYNALLNDGQTLFFQSLNPQTVGWKDSYIVVNSVEFERLSLAYAPAETIFKYTISFTEVARPATTSVDTSVNTWEMVLNSHTDWQDVLSSHSTWLDVYQDPQDLH